MSQAEITRAEMDQLMDRHYRAEERSDVPGAIEDLADDVNHELAGAYRGQTKEQALAFYEDLFGRLRLRRIVSKRRLYGPGFAVDEAVVEAETLAGNPAPFRLLHVFEFKDGRITRGSAWQASLEA